MTADIQIIHWEDSNFTCICVTLFKALKWSSRASGLNNSDPSLSMCLWQERRPGPGAQAGLTEALSSPRPVILFP